MRTSAGSTALPWAAIAGVVASTGAIALLLFAAPIGFRGIWGLAPEGGRLYLEALGLPVSAPHVGRASFALAFRALLVAAWISWIVMIAAVWRAAPSRRASLAVISAASLALAVAGPPVLSFDVFGYVAYGRLVYVHDLNPYLYARAALEQAGDPAASFLFAPVPMPYGPVWPLLVAVLGPPAAAVAGLFGEILLHKLLAAGALIVAAMAGSRAADALSPGRGGVALLAIGLNPLLLIEGPLGGHNDFVPVALVIWAAALSVASRHRASYLAIGLAIATKATAIGVLPLIFYDRWVHGDRARRSADLVWLVTLAAAPAFVLSFFFAGPAVVIETVRARVDIVGPTGAAAWLGHALLLTGLGAGLWMIHTGESRGAWVTGWVVVSAAIVLTSTTLRFPWYVAWPLAPALIKWDERHRILITAVAVCGFLATWIYTVGT